MWLWFRFFILIPTLFFLGCGYSLSHRVKKVFEHPQGVFVSIFTNDTEEMGAEMVFTNALLRELKVHQNIRLVDRKESTPLELKGVVEKIAYQPSAFFAPAAGTNKLQSYVMMPDQINVVATIKLNLINRETKEVLWSQSTSGSRIVSANLTRTGDKEGASGFGIYTQSLIDARYGDIARDIMRDMYDSMVESL